MSASKDAVACEFGNGLALLDMRSNIYYSLNSVGAYIWELIQEPRPISEIRSAVLDRYNVDPERCRADVDGLLKGLADAGLARLHDEELV
ncbi:PqqD family protein [Mesorhizobium sp. M0586]|uniref:PqqD family protein n=1 Tax=unclassified Mesorhizobium TaxID=325217 RepID=UPI00333D7434